jgi:chromosome partitioning protein
VRIMAMMNQKGGVGKTTTAVNLGAALGEMGRRVCMIDLDPQAHLTINYGLEPQADTTNLYHVLCGERSVLEAVHKVSDTVALIPSSIDLAAAEVELVSVIGREQVLKRKLEQATHDFDYLVLDCPPSLGLLTINALAVATEVVIPMQPHFLPLQGVAKLLETIQLVRERMNPALKVSGIVLTMYDAQTKLSAEVVHELQSFFDEARGKSLPWSEARIFNTRIRRNIKLAESPSFGQTILQYEPASNGAADYRALARELAAMEQTQPTADARHTVAEPTPPAGGLNVNVNPRLDAGKLAGAVRRAEGATGAGTPSEAVA